jgi:hypothetical protein
MNVFRHQLRLLAIAFVAIVGASSTVRDAKAATAAGSARECCLKPVCTACCCEPASASSQPQPAEKAVVLLPAERSVSTPAGPCECRSSDPTSPVASRDTRPVEDRGGQENIATPAPSSERTTSVAFARLIPPSVSPPHSPLYLRNARLLI